MLDWYRRHQRDLPWRRTRDAYAIWVAEVMLQQTRVATVLPYYERFIERYPDPARLACASEEEVLSLWSGLGYYRRARALRRGALTVIERHGGRLPREPEALRRLPSIGPYTAGAIASMGFDLPEPVLDGNVRRVLSRVFAIGGRRSEEPTERTLWRIAGILVEGPHPGDLNQALMELGALVCTPRGPKCLVCPLFEPCRARAGGRPEAYPARAPRRPTEKVRVAVALVERDGKFLLERPKDRNPLRGSWDVPALELGEDADPREAIREALSQRHGLAVRVDELRATASHGILQRRLRLEIYPCRLRRGRVSGRTGLRWTSPAGLERTPVSGATRKVLRAGLDSTPGR